jgi:hypothetical protein
VSPVPNWCSPRRGQASSRRQARSRCNSGPQQCRGRVRQKPRSAVGRRNRGVKKGRCEVVAARENAAQTSVAAKPLSEARLDPRLSPCSRVVSLDTDGDAAGEHDTAVQVRLHADELAWYAAEILCVRPLPGRRTSYSTERHAEAARRAALALV